MTDNRIEPVSGGALGTPNPVTLTFYYPSPFGFIFSARRLDATLRIPFLGLIALASTPSPMRIAADGNLFLNRASGLCFRDGPARIRGRDIVCIALNPRHTRFRWFRQLRFTGVHMLDRAAFSGLDSLLRAAVSETLSLSDAKSLFDDAIAAACTQMNRPESADFRAQRLIAHVQAHPSVSIADLASQLGLSYHRTSHLFGEAIGIPMRTYQQWQKIHQATSELLRGGTVTDAAHAAGFANSAHLSSTFQRAFGRAPTALTRDPSVRVYVAGEHTWRGAQE